MCLRAAVAALAAAASAMAHAIGLLDLRAKGFGPWFDLCTVAVQRRRWNPHLDGPVMLYVVFVHVLGLFKA